MTKPEKQFFGVVFLGHSFFVATYSTIPACTSVTQAGLGTMQVLVVHATSGRAIETAQNFKELFRRALFSGPIQYHKILPWFSSATETTTETIDMHH